MVKSNPYSLSVSESMERLIHPLVYLCVHVKFRVAAWWRSWEILKAFDQRAWTRRLCLYGAVVTTLIVLSVVAFSIALHADVSPRGERQMNSPSPGVVSCSEGRVEDSLWLRALHGDGWHERMVRHGV